MSAGQPWVVAGAYLRVWGQLWAQSQGVWQCGRHPESSDGICDNPFKKTTWTLSPFCVWWLSVSTLEHMQLFIKDGIRRWRALKSAIQGQPPRRDLWTPSQICLWVCTQKGQLDSRFRMLAVVIWTAWKTSWAWSSSLNSFPMRDKKRNNIV